MILSAVNSCPMWQHFDNLYKFVIGDMTKNHAKPIDMNDISYFYKLSVKGSD